MPESTSPITKIKESKLLTKVKKNKNKLDFDKKAFLKDRKKRKYGVIVIVALILCVLLYFFRGLFLVALVNNKPITRLSLIKRLEKESGQATLENLVIKELILQEARKKGVSISQEDIQEEIDNITEIIEAQGTTLEDALSMQGQTINDLRENIKIQKTAEEILKDEIQVSDEEALEYFEENKEFYEDKEFVDLEEEIKEQLSQEKLQVKFSELLENLKNESDIRYLVTF